MNIDINDEINKLNIIVNNKKILSFENYGPEYYFSNFSMKVKYLLYVLELTYKHTEIEIYLKELLQNFRIVELNNFDRNNFNILHYMIKNLPNISLNSFEIIINFGISVNSQTLYNYIPLHFMCCKLLEHEQNVIALFVKHGVDLNILNCYNKTVLDEIVDNKFIDNEHFKIIAMTLIDFGARINNPSKYTDKNTLQFIESYHSSNIKPAIKK